MRQLKAVAVFLQERHRIFPGMHNPEHIHFKTNVLRLRLRHEQVEQRPRLIRLKFVTVRVVEKFDPFLGEHPARLVEDVDRSAALLLVKRIFVPDPGRAGILQPQNLCLAHDAFRIVAKLLIWEVGAHRSQPPLIQLGLEFLRREVVRAGKLHIREAHIAHLIECARHVLGELIAQTVKLQSQRPLEARPSSDRRQNWCRN